MANKANRQAQGAGTIRQRPDGRWEARYTIGRDLGSGKQIQKSIYGSTQDEVRRKLNSIVVDIDNGVYTEPSKLTVSEWLDIWLEEYTSNLKPYTIASYKGHCNNYLKHNFGAIKLSALNAHTIQRMYNTLYKGTEKKNPLSAKTIANIHGVLHKALEQAVKVGYIRFNPSDSCTLPRVIKKEMHPLEEETIKEFILACEGEPYKVLYITALFTGMRQGEILGLRWSDIDFDNGRIVICRQLQREKTPSDSEYGKGVYYFTTLKNNKTRKFMPAPFVMKMLKEHKTQQSIQKMRLGCAWGNGDKLNDDLVFVNEIGCHLSHVTVYKRYKAIVKQLNIADARFHDLRHTYAVTALQNGDDIKTVQETLGHHTAAFTLDVYGHVTEKMRSESAARMENFINSVISQR